MNISFTNGPKAALPIIPASQDELYKKSIVIDGCSPLTSQGYSDRFYAGGVTVACATIYPLAKPLPETIAGIQEWYTTLKNDNRLIQIQTIDDIYKAKAENKLGIMLAFQGCAHLQGDLDMIEVYYRLGIRQMMLCYNVKNALGDGCTEPGNGGLSIFGEKAIKEMTRLGIVVDLSHTGHRTTMEAMEVMLSIGKPCIFSHGNSYSVHPSARNLRDDQIIKVAKTGGIVGVTGYPDFVSADRKPTVNQFIDHIDYYVHLVGIDHVSLGLDYYWLQAGLLPDDQAKAFYWQRIESGQWSRNAYKEPPVYFPEEIGMPEKLPNIVPALRNRGYADEDIQKILGGNYMRVLKEIFK